MIRYTLTLTKTCAVCDDVYSSNLHENVEKILLSFLHQSERFPVSLCPSFHSLKPYSGGHRGLWSVYLNGSVGSLDFRLDIVFMVTNGSPKMLRQFWELSFLVPRL